MAERKPKKVVDHSSRKHAILSASGASRWLNCTPSPKLEQQFENKSSQYADEGTLAHEFAELNLKKQLKIIDHKQHDELVFPFLGSLHYSEEMEEEVQKHIDYVIQQFTEAKRNTADALLLIEEKVDLTFVIENGFGTCDNIIISDGVLEVIDLKYGKGVRVSAKDNSQLKLYGLGALYATELMYAIHTVRLTVTQPRMDSISSWEISSEELKQWGEDTVKPKAEMATLGEGDQVAGDWCRFCRAKVRCKALADQNLEIAKLEFADPKLLTDKQLIEVYKLSPQIQHWMNSISEYLFDEALKGKKWEEHKLVEGRSNRVWLSEDNVKIVLEQNEYDKNDYLSTPKLLGIGAIEKLVGKNDFMTLLGPNIVKPQGKPTLVHEDDKRPEMGLNQAKLDFCDSID